jgi:hypothetical protein
VIRSEATEFRYEPQGSGPTLAAMQNFFSTVSVGNTACSLPAAKPGMEITVINQTGTALLVFPQSGESMNGTANASASVVNTAFSMFACGVTGAWWSKRAPSIERRRAMSSPDKGSGPQLTQDVLYNNGGVITAATIYAVNANGTVNLVFFGTATPATSATGFFTIQTWGQGSGRIHLSSNRNGMMSPLPDRPRRQDLNRDIRARQQPLDPGTSVGFAGKWPVARSPNCSVTVFQYGPFYTARVIKFPATAGMK